VQQFNLDMASSVIVLLIRTFLMAPILQRGSFVKKKRQDAGLMIKQNKRGWHDCTKWDLLKSKFAKQAVQLFFAAAKLKNKTKTAS